MKMIFVFGSNLAGRHGAGSAKYARMKLGAVYGVGEGPTGECYALPTKNENIQTRSLEDIEKSVKKFIDHASQNLDQTFKVIPIGCGLAGLHKRQVAQMFMKYELSENVVFSSDWFQTKLPQNRL